MDRTPLRRMVLNTLILLYRQCQALVPNTESVHCLRNRSGSFAMLAAMPTPSWRVNPLAANRRHASTAARKIKSKAAL